MKKKLLFILLFIMCFTFIPSIKALKCYYEGIEYYYIDGASYCGNCWGLNVFACAGKRSEALDGIEECEEEDDEDCSINKNNAHEFFADIEIPSTYSEAEDLYINYEFYDKDDDKRSEKVQPSWHWMDIGCHDCENWFQPINGTGTTGLDFVAVEPECPEFISVRLGVDGNNKLRLYLAHTEDEARSYIDWMLRIHDCGDPLGFAAWDMSYLFLAKKYKETGQTDDSIKEAEYSSCADFTDKKNCTTNKYYSCLWVKKKTSKSSNIEYCNFDSLTYVKCGDSWDIPDKLPGIVSFLANFIKIVTPIILILVSILTLVKAVASSKDEDIKKAKSTLIKRLIAAAIVFFVIQITQFVILKVADSGETGSMKTCFSCLLNNDCSKNRYYKTLVGKSYECRYLSDNSKPFDCTTN